MTSFGTGNSRGATLAIVLVFIGYLAVMFAIDRWLAR
jgi:hypothetical protein